jgi:hypothetical protein
MLLTLVRGPPDSLHLWTNLQEGGVVTQAQFGTLPHIMPSHPRRSETPHQILHLTGHLLVEWQAVFT